MKENDHGSGEGSRNLGEFPFAVSHHGCIVGPRCCFAARSSNRCCSSCRWRCCCAKGSTSHMLSVLARALPKAIQHHIQRQPRANLRPMNKFDPWLSAMKVLRPLGHLARSRVRRLPQSSSPSLSQASNSMGLAPMEIDSFEKGINKGKSKGKQKGKG